MIVIIDSGHGINTPGKCSPDGKFKEWKYCRELANLVTLGLISLGYGVVNLMQGIDNDESLRSRCDRINKIVSNYKDCILVSLHNNAAGSNKLWYNASGWSVFVSMNASNNSKLLATKLCKNAILQKIMGNRSIPKCMYWLKNLAICRDTKCPAVLVENMFMDNKHDIEFLNSAEGKEKLINTILNGILDYKIEKSLINM